MLHFIITKGHICIMYLVEIYSCIILAFSLFVHASLCTNEALFLIWSGDKCTAPNAGSLHGFDHVQDNIDVCFFFAQQFLQMGTPLGQLFVLICKNPIFFLNQSSIPISLIVDHFRIILEFNATVFFLKFSDTILGRPQLVSEVGLDCVDLLGLHDQLHVLACHHFLAVEDVVFFFFNPL